MDVLVTACGVKSLNGTPHLCCTIRFGCLKGQETVDLARFKRLVRGVENDVNHRLALKLRQRNLRTLHLHGRLRSKDGQTDSEDADGKAMPQLASSYQF